MIPAELREVVLDREERVDLSHRTRLLGRQHRVALGGLERLLGGVAMLLGRQGGDVHLWCGDARDAWVHVGQTSAR